MSNYLAIATVTATLQRMLQTTVQVDVDGARVTTVRPDSLGNSTPETGVNLYLYHVIPNPAWRNADLRTRFSEGALAKRPQAALDLYYLVTCYGNEVELEPQRLLGSVVRTLHAQPVLTRDMIQATIADDALTFLADSNLSEQVETVKFMPLSLTTDELSNIWSVFFQTPHALSIAYQAGVLLIESDDIPQRALPVRDRQFHMLPSQPKVTQVVSQRGSRQPITADSTLLVQGQQLHHREALVQIGSVAVMPQQINQHQLTVSLSTIPGRSLRAGVQSLQVIHPAAVGAHAPPHRGVESNVAAFVLRPTITAIQVRDVQGDDSTNRSATISVQVTPGVGKSQRVLLSLNERSTDQPVAYTFDAARRETDTDTIQVPVQAVKAGTYVARLQVDGAESLLTVDQEPGSDTLGQYIGPAIVIP